MKGLLRKDIYMLWSYCKTFLLLILVFSLVNLVEPNTFYTIYPVMVGSMLPVTLISYEERCKWIIYCQTLPVSRRLVVVEKYVFSILVTLSILTVSGIVQYVVLMRAGSFELGHYLDLMSTLVTFSLVGPGLTLPLIFKLGSEKGRIAYYFVIGAACTLSFLLPELSFSGLPVPMGLFPVAAVGFYAGSCLLSIRFYQKREL